MASQRWWVNHLTVRSILATALVLMAITLPRDSTFAQNSSSGNDSPTIESTLCSPKQMRSSEGTRYLVSVDELNLRAGPGTTCDIVAELERGATLELAGDSVQADGYVWVPVSSQLGDGYVIAQSIQEVPPGSTCETRSDFGATLESGFTAMAVNLRGGPGLACAVVATLSAGSPVQVRGVSVNVDGENWLPVSTPFGDGYLVQEGFAPPGSWEQPVAVAVLMYHDIGDNYSRYVVAPWQLEQQLIWLRDNGYTSITPRDLVANLDRGAPLPPKPVILSVDDGWASTRVFRDLLTAYGFKGTYVLPSYAELTPEEIYDLNQSGEVCGHSASHPFLDQLSYDAQWYEIVENKAWLDSITGVSTTCFAYPFGAFNETTTQIVIDAGFQIAFHAWDGVQYFDYMDRWHITRIEVSGEWDVSVFAAAVAF